MEFSVLRAALADQRDQWTSIWESLPAERRDVYFLPGYALASEADGRGEALCGVARENGAVWLHPFLKCPITPLDGPSEEPGLYDIQTAYGYGGPVVNEAGENADFLGNVWRRFSDWCADAGVVGEFCRFHPLLENHRWAANEMTVRGERKTVVMNLKTYPDAVWKDSHFSTHRNMIRRAEREGYTYHSKSGVSVEDIASFAPMYARSLDRLQARDETRFGNAYFKTLAGKMADKAWIGTVRMSERADAAVLVLQGTQSAHIHLIGYGGDGSSHGMSNCLYHGTALEAARRGLQSLHLGGGNTNDDKDSLYQFKSKLSPERRLFHVGTWCHNPDRYEQLGTKWEERNGPRPGGYFLFYRTEDSTEKPNP